MNLSAIHKDFGIQFGNGVVVCDIGGYEFVSYSQALTVWNIALMRCL